MAQIYLQIMQAKLGRAHSPLGMHCTSGIPVGSCPGAHLYVKNEPILLNLGAMC